MEHQVGAKPLPPYILKLPTFIETTIGERGPVLPIGLPNSVGKVERSLGTKPWRMREERELGQFRKDNQNANMAKYVSIVLSHMCTTLGGNDFTALDSVKKQLNVSMMHVGDVFYAYIWLRINAMSERLRLKLKSPHSGEEFEWTGDLRTTSVTCVDKPEDALWEYQLQHPFELRGKTITRLTFGPQRWNALETIPGGQTNIGAAKSLMIMSSLKGIPDLGPNAIIDESELDEMSKPDIERIAGYINDYSPGPDMTLEPVDPQGRPFKAVLDWTYDSFFGSSSQ